MALYVPSIFDQLWGEFEIASSQDPEKPDKPSWKRPGETATEARDRLRAEREAAKARLG